MAVIVYMLVIAICVLVGIQLGTHSRLKDVERELEHVESQVLAAQNMIVEHMQIEHPEMDRVFLRPGDYPISYASGYYIGGTVKDD